jgi:hypothetical protein
VVTIRLLGIGPANMLDELGDGGHGMAPDHSGAPAAWLLARLREAPAAGTNTLVVTHFPNIREACADNASELGDGEALIVHAGRDGNVAVVARVKMGDWSQL